MAGNAWEKHLSSTTSSPHHLVNPFWWKKNPSECPFGRMKTFAFLGYLLLATGQLENHHDWRVTRTQKMCWVSDRHHPLLGFSCFFAGPTWKYQLPTWEDGTQAGQLTWGSSYGNLSTAHCDIQVRRRRKGANPQAPPTQERWFLVETDESPMEPGRLIMIFNGTLLQPWLSIRYGPHRGC